jgi:hypothetical protein
MIEFKSEGSDGDFLELMVSEIIKSLTHCAERLGVLSDM